MARATHVFSGEELSLLDAIHADPKNDRLRLVYVDWQEDRGEERFAAFIRYQIDTGKSIEFPRPNGRVLKLWRESPPPEDPVEAMRRELGLYGKRWAGRCHEKAPLSYFFRGMPVAGVRGYGDRDGRYKDVLARSSPRLRFHVTLTDDSVEMQSALTDAIFARTHSIALVPNERTRAASLQDAGVAVLAGWSGLPLIHEVYLWGVDHARMRAVRASFPAQIDVTCYAALPW